MAKAKSITASHYIKLLIALAIIAVFWVFDPWGEITKTGMVILGIFLGAIVLILGNEIPMATLLSIVMVSFVINDATGYTGAGIFKALEMSVGYWMVPFTIAAVCLCHALTEVGIMKRIAYWFLRLPVANKSPWSFTFVFWLAAMFIGSWSDPVTSMVFFSGIAKTICGALGYKKKDSYTTLLRTGATFCICISQIMTPISHAGVVAGMALYQSTTGTAIEFLTYTLIGYPIGIVVCILTSLLFRFTFKADFSLFEGSKLQAIVGEKSEPWTKREKWVLAIFLFIVVLWVAPGVLSMVAPGLAITTFMNSLTMTIPAILGIILLIGIYVEKEPLLDFGKALAPAVPWDAMLLIMCVMMFGTLVTLPNLGITAALTSLVAPLAEHMTVGGWLVGFLVAAAVIVVANFFANSPTMMIFLAAIVPVAGMFNANAYALAMIIIMAANLGFATPAAFPVIAMLYGDEWEDKSKVPVYGALAAVLCILVLGTILYPIASLFG